MRSTSLPRSFTALAGSNLAAQSAEQLSLAAVPLVAVLAAGVAALAWRAGLRHYVGTGS